ncbi:MAG: nitrogen fixation protein NifQ [Burkholderiales bacterium]|nr:nitrogen fixation protein NifQ [Burkholderiales bacterium]
MPQEVLHARGIGDLSRPAAAIVARAETRGDEVDDVRSLLLAHADAQAGSADAARSVATTVALACLGDNHLWQDLQFASRAELSALMRHWFPALVAKNVADMKWKKFLYKQLCEREQIFICKAPTCAVCADYRVCFGPEE